MSHLLSKLAKDLTRSMSSHLRFGWTFHGLLSWGRLLAIKRWALVANRRFVRIFDFELQSLKMEKKIRFEKYLFKIMNSNIIPFVPCFKWVSNTGRYALKISLSSFKCPLFFLNNFALLTKCCKIYCVRMRAKLDLSDSVSSSSNRTPRLGIDFSRSVCKWFDTSVTNTFFVF